MAIFGHEIINELYIGETKKLKEAQHNLSQFRDNMIRNEYNDMKKVKNDKWYKEFKKSIKNTFGYKTFDFKIQFIDRENAYCHTLFSQIKKDREKYDKNVLVTKNGFKYKNEYAFRLVITSALFTNTNYSDREIMAIILHEIGHSFYMALDGKAIDLMDIRETINNVNLILQLIISFIGAFNIIKSSIDLLSGVNEILKTIKPKIIIRKSILSIFDTLVESGIDILKILLLLNGGYIPSLLMAIISKANPISLANTIFGYKDEKSADSFATMYGYGPELSSSLQKLDLSRKTDTRITAKALNIMLIPCSIILFALNEHPDCISRTKNQIDYLEKEYANIDDKETKAEIKSQINSIKKGLDKTENILSSIKDKDINNIRYMYTIIISKLYKIDVRELLSKYDPHVENQKAYDKYKK